MQSQTTSALVDEYVTWVTERGYPLLSADELLAQLYGDRPGEGPTADIAWLEDHQEACQEIYHRARAITEQLSAEGLQ